jgi:hypothetical protein
VTVRNPLYNASCNKTIGLVSNFKNLAFIPNNTVTPQNQTRSFAIAYDSLGEPSCMMLWYTSDLNTTEVGAYGTNQTVCLLYSNASFLGPYSSISQANQLTFNQTIGYQASFTMNALFMNQISNLSLFTQFTVSSSDCALPTLSIQGSSTNFLNPVVYKRSQLFTLAATTTLNCDTSLDNKKQWLLQQVDPSTGSVIQSIDITNNTSSFTSQLVVQKNSLSYNTYKFTYQVTMDQTSSLTEAAVVFKASVFTYVSIVRSGVVVFAFNKGLQSVTRGTQQAVVLNPGLYSYDIDGIQSPMNLSYMYYCRTIDNGVPNGYPKSQKLSFNVNVDLQTMKTINDSTLYSNTSCFSSPGRRIRMQLQHPVLNLPYLLSAAFYFNFSDTSLTILPGGLAYVHNRVYEILVTGADAYGDEFSQYVQVTIANYSSLPIIQLGYFFVRLLATLQYLNVLCLTLFKLSIPEPV